MYSLRVEGTFSSAHNLRGYKGKCEDLHGHNWRVEICVKSKELDNIDIEISVLTPLKKVSSYKDVSIPGDGVLVRSGFNSGVFLPQVADETGWNREQFLTYLCAHKAGLPPDAWKEPGTEIYIFSAEVFSEERAEK